LKKARVDRWASPPNGVGTFGTLVLFDEENKEIFRCRTIELPWRLNEPEISAIPAGTYFAKLGDFKGKYPNYEIQNVNGRTHIEIHRGNTVKDFLGCVGLGRFYRIDEENNRHWVTSSKKTMTEFTEAAGGDKWIVVEIRENVVSTQSKA